MKNNYLDGKIKVSSCPYENLLLFFLNVSCITKTAAECYVEGNPVVRGHSFDYFLNAGILREYRGIDENQNGVDYVTLGSEGYRLLDMAYVTSEEYRETQNISEALVNMIRFCEDHS